MPRSITTQCCAAAAFSAPVFDNPLRGFAAHGNGRRRISSIARSFLVRISVTLVVAVVALETPGANPIEEKKIVSESKREHLSKVLDVERTRVWTRIISAFHDMLRAPGQTEWSPARLQGVLGNAFSFEMKKGGGDVWQEGNLDWWLVFETRQEEELGCRIQRFQTRQGDTDPDESRKIKAAAWDAIASRASPDPGQRHPRSHGIVKDTQSHAGVLTSLRGYAAAYLRDLTDVFPVAASELESAAGHYDRVAEASGKLYSVCERSRDADEFTDDARAEVSRLISTALQAERDAIASVKAALALIEATE